MFYLSAPVTIGVVKTAVTVSWSQGLVPLTWNVDGAGLGEPELWVFVSFKN